MEIVLELLERLKEKNEEDNPEGLLKQEVSESTSFPRGIPTLEKGHYRSPTPMIEARFSHVGTWVNAAIGHTWLSVPEMEAVWDDDQVREQLQVRKDHWEGSVLAKYTWDELSLFGIDREEYEETYLVWSAREGQEPQVYLYVGDEYVFRDLKEFLEWLTSSPK